MKNIASIFFAGALLTLLSAVGGWYHIHLTFVIPIALAIIGLLFALAILDDDLP